MPPAAEAEPSSEEAAPLPLADWRAGSAAGSRGGPRGGSRPADSPGSRPGSRAGESQGSQQVESRVNTRQLRRARSTAALDDSGNTLSLVFGPVFEGATDPHTLTTAQEKAILAAVRKAESAAALVRIPRDPELASHIDLEENIPQLRTHPAAVARVQRAKEVKARTAEPTADVRASMMCAAARTQHT